MGLETGSFIKALNPAFPDSDDQRLQGDDHIRLIKAVLKATFGEVSKEFWGIRTVTTNTVVTADDVFTQIVVSGSAAITITIPLLSTLPNIFRFEIHNIGTGVVTVVRTGSDTINGGAADKVYSRERHVYTKIGSALERPVAFAPGMIMPFYGTTVPAGWALCNGTNGTPDLRDRFLLGVSPAAALGASGGSRNAVVVAHGHGVVDNGHNHAISTDARFTTTNDPANAPVSRLQGDPSAAGQPPNATLIAAPFLALSTSNIGISAAGESGENKNMPPYTAVNYIVKL